MNHRPRVCVAPVPSGLSRAMYRVANALSSCAPPTVEIVDEPRSADLQVLHVIGPQVLDRWLSAPDYAVIQYCLVAPQGETGANVETGETAEEVWGELWRGRVVWSYYDLRPHLDFSSPSSRFYFSPLGVDDAFANNPIGVDDDRPIGVLTTGYVDGPGAEAIRAVAEAATASSLSTLHVGPPVLLDDPPRGWSSMAEITDSQLARFYCQSRWVSGLRHIEGFELPVIEGLACGCRPVVFDRLETRRWFDGYAEFIPETTDHDELVSTLSTAFSRPPTPVTEDERQSALDRFHWPTIALGFWEAVTEYLGCPADADVEVATCG